MNQPTVENEMVDVLMITYNHEKYVEHAINSILMQKTDFNFKLLIHDDASTDKTPEIIKRYKERYPDKIEAVLQQENQFLKGKRSPNDYLIPLVKSKYIATCEGDDFWIDEYKLQKQVDFMESHPECSAVAARYYEVDVNENIKKVSHEGMPTDCFYNKENVLKYGVATLHINSVLIPTSIRCSKRYIDGKRQCCTLGGHSFLIYFLATQGLIYISSDIMSSWRMNNEIGGTSFCSRNRAHPISYAVELLRMYNRYRGFFGQEFDFSDHIVQRAVQAIKLVLTGKEKGISRVAEMRKIMSCLKLNDCKNIVVYCLKRL